ncbi:MAG: A/G-specific adenine glycosylase [Acidiferrobacterales bacterium]|nr:A/G-specific adenine glycosylase [Acidiferrobacterales bacterium]
MNGKLSPALFRRRLLAWFDKHGRKDLPWQRSRNPYRIWVSEIMLQQTQVSTVIPYYNRFLKRFANVKQLADAPIDEVLHHWTGLGYYARARNLHKAAKLIRDQHHGRFPKSLDALQALPGIGRSTAGAILAFAYSQRHPILDGNVKRVLTRLHAVDRWPGERETEKSLWEIAERYTPAQRVGDYTQAIMDLGATVCRRGQPRCELCPMTSHCVAYAEGDPARYPIAKQRKPLPDKQATMLLIRRDRHEVLLQRRPPTGIWGGLWSFPERPGNDINDLATWAREKLGLSIRITQALPVIPHTFSHFRLHIQPVTAELVGEPPVIMELPDSVWYKLEHPDSRGLAAPVQRLLQQMRKAQ